MPASIASATGLVSGRELLRADDDQVDLLLNQIAHLLLLGLALVLRIDADQLDLRVLLGFLLDVLVHLNAPRLAEIALRHSDRKLLRRAGRGAAASACRAPGQSPAARNPRAQALRAPPARAHVVVASSFLFSRQSGASAPALFLPLNQDGDDDDRRLYHHARRDRNRVKAQNLVDIADDQNAQQRKAQPAAPARKARAADDDGSDRIQLEGRARLRDRRGPAGRR